jgi:hypothetical protein
VLGDIDLDPASCEVAQRWVKAKKFYTEADDGLSKPWHGHVFLNPPYSAQGMSRFVDKLLAERNASRVKAAILLSNNCTETGWFQKAAMLAQAICFSRGRMKFLDANGREPESTTPWGQAFVYFGPDAGKFFDVFSGIGVVLGPDFLNRRAVPPAASNVAPVEPALAAAVETGIKSVWLAQAQKRQKRQRLDRALKWRKGQQPR